MITVLGILFSLTGMIVVFVLLGGNAPILWNPGEVGLILNCAICIFAAQSSVDSMKSTLGYIATGLFGADLITKESAPDFLKNIYTILSQKSSLSATEFEDLLESDTVLFTSDVFKKMPRERMFVRDYLRMIILGPDFGAKYIKSMHDEVSAAKSRGLEAASNIERMADATPAIGIVVAILGIIRALAEVDGPILVLGHMVSEALVGTLFGIWMCYSAVFPIANQVKAQVVKEVEVLNCISAALGANFNKMSPIICVECGRKVLPESIRPSFADMRDHLLS